MDKIDFTKYNRLFTFGCSFTRYDWPTWADILGIGFSEYYNYGYQGAGNHYIFQSFIEAHARHNITDNDLVLIMWSAAEREDRYISDFVTNKWACGGAVFNNPFYDDKYVERYFDPYGFFLRDMGYISTAKYMLDGFGIDYEFMSMGVIDAGVDSTNTPHAIHNAAVLYYKTILRLRENMFNVLGSNWHGPGDFIGINVRHPRRPDFIDLHPPPRQHFEYLQHLFPKTEFTSAMYFFVEQSEHELRKDGVFDIELHANLVPRLLKEFRPDLQPYSMQRL